MLTTSLYIIHPTPSSQKDSSTATVTNSSPSISTRFEASTDLDIKIIIASVFAGLVILVAATIAIMMTILSTRFCHFSRDLRNELSVENFQHETETIREENQTDHDYDQP